MPTETYMIKLRNFFHDENGTTAIEFGLIATGILIGIIGAVQSIGTGLNNAFTQISTAL